MPAPPPTAAPPNFYDNLPAGGGAPMSAEPEKKSDVDDELMKGFAGIIRVLTKMGKLKEAIKPGIDKIKEDVKSLVVQGLKKDPSQLEEGEEKPEASPAEEKPPAAATPPKIKDETHAA